MGGCTACHGTNAVTAANVPDDEIDLNNKCMACHGDRRKYYPMFRVTYGKGFPY
jgi:mono/diheme cytochrome c family protein